jgi:hypothetical protein
VILRTVTPGDRGISGQVTAVRRQQGQNKTVQLARAGHDSLFL